MSKLEIRRSKQCEATNWLCDFLEDTRTTVQQAVHCEVLLAHISDLQNENAALKLSDREVDEPAVKSEVTAEHVWKDVVVAATGSDENCASVGWLLAYANQVTDAFEERFNKNSLPGEG